MKVAAILGEAEASPVPIEDFLGVPVTTPDGIQVGRVFEAEVQDGMILAVLKLDAELQGFDVGVEDLSLGD